MHLHLAAVLRISFYIGFITKKAYEPIPVLAAEIVLAAPYVITDSVAVKIAAFTDILRTA